MTATALPFSSSQRSTSPAREPAEKRALPAIVRDAYPLLTSDAVDIAFEICDALASLHSNGIVHGDLGPHCIKLFWPRAAGLRGDVEIFARPEREASGTIRVEGGKPVVDRGPFVAPEQRRVGAPIDARADIFAVGALLKWMLAGDARPRTLETIVAACLSEDPAARPATVDELAEKIAAYASAPPECFERVAERRRKADDAARAQARQETRDGRITLERLEMLAVERERQSSAPPPRLVLAEEESAPDTLASAQMPVIDVDDDAEEVTDDDDDDFVTIAREAPSVSDAVPSPLGPLPSFPLPEDPPASDDRASWGPVDKAATSDAYLAQLANERARLMPTVEARKPSVLPWIIAAVVVTLASFVAVYAYLVLRPIAAAPAPAHVAVETKKPAPPAPLPTAITAPAETTPTISAASLPDAPGTKKAVPTFNAASLPDAR